MQIIRKKLHCIIILAACVAALAGCSVRGSAERAALSPNYENTNASQWLNTGTLVISRPLPETHNNNQGMLLGFMPQKTPSEMPATTSLKIDINKKTAILYHGSIKLEEFELKDLEGLVPGNYTIQHKQRHPVWYAHDHYYINRGLAIPKEDDRDRYLKGALGDFVIFLDEQLPLHNSQVWSDDVGGVRISDNNIAKMYYKLDIGARVVVQ